MGFRTLAFTYVLGGLTFLPLVLVTVLLSAWYLLPKTQESKEEHGNHKAKSVVHEDDEVKKEREDRSRQASTSDTGASGTFAVLRKYDFQSAIQALNARNNASASATANGTNEGNAEDGATQSVYQSMYRSVFPGNKNANNNASILENNDGQQDAVNRRKATAANVMYIVLRHGHLMLYDSQAQLEVRHVLSLAHHNVSLRSGKDAADEIDDRRIPEADLFIKRTAIVLTPIELPNGALQGSASQKAAKPIYLFSATSFEKEDFFHALLASRSKPPTLLPLESEALIKLQSSLHSSTLTAETRALNALIGRVFLGIHHTDYLKAFILGKIEKKLARIQKPSFIPLLHIRSLDMGDAAPIFTNLKLRDLNISGDTTISADMRYSGGLSITLLAVAKLDLGARFKTRTVDLVLKASMQRVQGTMLLHIKPPPSNRLWYCFENMPEVEVRAEPVVSERKITYGFVLRAIEERVRTALGEGLVKPNWDDVPMPLTDTRGSHARGGLWSDEGEDEHPELRPESAHVLQERNEKTKSVPSFDTDMDTAVSTGLSSDADVNVAKIRHAATMPVDQRQVKRRPVGSSPSAQSPIPSPEGSQQPTPLSKTFRSPSISSPSPVVAVDDQTVEPVRTDDPSLRPSGQTRRLWRPGGTTNLQQQQKDALDGLRDLKDRAEQALTRPSAVAMSDSYNDSNRSLDDLSSGQVSDDGSIRNQQVSDSSTPPSRSTTMRSTSSERSNAASRSSTRTQQPGQRKANILAAAGAATNAARNWGWNTYQKNKGMLPRAGLKQDSSQNATNQPMGRGQPLPPPGQPLPGPQKGLWSGVSGMGSMRRKPVPALPPRRARPGEPESSQSSPNSRIPVLSRTKSGTLVTSEHDVEDEFGTWQENVVTEDLGHSGDSSESLNVVQSEADHHRLDEPSNPEMVEEDLLQLSENEEETPTTARPEETKTPTKPKKVPPPLPVRRERIESQDHHPKLDEHERGTLDHSESTDSSHGTALRVPADAAGAIAAENSTIEREIGLADDQEHIDKASAVEAEVRPEYSDETQTQTRGSDVSHLAVDTAEATQPSGRKRANTAEKFLRGEDVKEEDFEEDRRISKDSDPDPRDGDGSVEPADSVAGTTPAAGDASVNDISERIKAQVQKHTEKSDGDV